MKDLVIFLVKNWFGILGLIKLMRRGIMRIINQDKLVPGLRVNDEVLVLEGAPGAAADLVGRIGRVSKTAVPEHIAVTVFNGEGAAKEVRTEAIKPEYLQRIIRVE